MLLWSSCKHVSKIVHVQVYTIWRIRINFRYFKSIHISTNTILLLFQVPQKFHSALYRNSWCRGFAPDHVVFYLMTCITSLDYVTFQVWKLDHSVVPPVQIPHYAVHVYGCEGRTVRVSLRLTFW